MWDEFASTLVAEFSDLNDVSEITRVSLRLLIAALLGGALGWEREQRGKSAGIKTHILVCMGAALFIMVPQRLGVISDAELGRVMQGIIAGIGFIGAGTILKGARNEKPKGLTTAAGIWLTAAIGVAAGLGRESSTILSTVFALLVMLIIPRIEKLAAPKDKQEPKSKP